MHWGSRGVCGIWQHIYIYSVYRYSIYIYRHIYPTHIQHMNAADVNIGYTELLVTSNSLYWYDKIVCLTYKKTLYANSCPCSIGASWVRGDQAFSEGGSAPIRAQRRDLGRLWKWWSASTLEMWGKVGKVIGKGWNKVTGKDWNKKVGKKTKTFSFLQEMLFGKYPVANGSQRKEFGG